MRSELSRALAVLDRRRRHFHRLPGRRSGRRAFARCKVLSSGRGRRRGERSAESAAIRASSGFDGLARRLLRGWTLSLLSDVGQSNRVATSFDPSRRRLARSFDRDVAHVSTSATSNSPAARKRRSSPSGGSWDLRLDEPIGAVDVRLGTTRGTNALLERHGARTAFVTTEGFGDVLASATRTGRGCSSSRSGSRADLYETVARARRAPRRRRLRAARARAEEVREKLRRAARARASSRSRSACLHSYRNPAHEELVAEIAAPLGFEHVSVSSPTGAASTIVPRGETTVVDAYLTPIVARLRSDAPTLDAGADLRLMTSAGVARRAPSDSSARTPCSAVRRAASSALATSRARRDSARRSASTWAAPAPT